MHIFHGYAPLLVNLLLYSFPVSLLTRSFLLTFVFSLCQDNPGKVVSRQVMEDILKSASPSTSIL